MFCHVRFSALRVSASGSSPARGACCRRAGAGATRGADNAYCSRRTREEARLAKKGKARGSSVGPAKKGKSGGSAMGNLLLAALVVGGGLFAGIRYTDRAQALVNGIPMHH